MGEPPLEYLSGFGNTFESEFVKGTLPKGRNNPRKTTLYTEQISGTAFTAPRAVNKRTWLYRIQPSVAGRSPAKDTGKLLGGCHPSDSQSVVDPLRWQPFQLEKNYNQEDVSFVQGLKLQCHGSNGQSAVNIYMYGCNESMSSTNTAMVNRDGDFLIMPQESALTIRTEMGILGVEPHEFLVIPQGITFQVDLVETKAIGYVLEVVGGPGFMLPELGPIGSNGLANARDFLHPTANAITDRTEYETPCLLTIKLESKLHEQECQHSLFNVVAWHGNYLPYKYDLRKFCAVSSVTYDHLDPSINTVLTCPSGRSGTALADVVVFRPRLLVTDTNTLRPPWFHMNVMSEYMGNIEGSYDAKKDFVPGGSSLHTKLAPHGPDAASYQAALEDPCNGPTQLEGTSFMFETCLLLKVSPEALEGGWRDLNYNKCWDDLTADGFFNQVTASAAVEEKSLEESGSMITVNKAELEDEQDETIVEGMTVFEDDLDEDGDYDI